MSDTLPEGEVPVVLRLHIVVESAISDWQRKTSIGKTIFQDEIDKLHSCPILLNCG